MSPERSIFIDALLELGFEQRPADPYITLELASNPFWKGVRIFSDGDRGSTIVVRLFRTYAMVTWSHRGVYHSERTGNEDYTFEFPEEWDRALKHIRQIIRLAEHLERTGMVQPIEWTRPERPKR